MCGVRCVLAKIFPWLWFSRIEWSSISQVLFKLQWSNESLVLQLRMLWHATSNTLSPIGSLRNEKERRSKWIWDYQISKLWFWLAILSIPYLLSLPFAKYHFVFRYIAKCVQAVLSEKRLRKTHLEWIHQLSFKKRRLFFWFLCQFSSNFPSVTGASSCSHNGNSAWTTRSLSRTKFRPISTTLTFHTLSITHIASQFSSGYRWLLAPDPAPAQLTRVHHIAPP